MAPRHPEDDANGTCLLEFLRCTGIGTLDTLSALAQTAANGRYRGMKRTVQVNVKMTQEDFNLLRKAADRRWPDAVITNSGIVLAFAKIAAREVLAKKK